MIVAGTGHRPDKLVGHESDVQLNIENYLTELKPSGVISGMADGFDMYLAVAALGLDIPLTCAVPFKGHGSRVSQAVYEFVISRADRVVYVSEDRYLGPWQFQARNVWMVKNCERLVTGWDGTLGGTYNCIQSALQVGRKMDRVWGKDPYEQIR